jgi:hypothetical protein
VAPILSALGFLPCSCREMFRALNHSGCDHRQQDLHAQNSSPRNQPSLLCSIYGKSAIGRNANIR